MKAISSNLRKWDETDTNGSRNRDLQAEKHGSCNNCPVWNYCKCNNDFTNDKYY